MATHQSGTGQQDASREVLQEFYRHSQFLLRPSKALESTRNYDEIINAAQQEISATGGYPTVWVYLFSDDLSYAVPLAAGGTISETIMTEETALKLTIKGDPMMEEIVAARQRRGDRQDLREFRQSRCGAGYGPLASCRSVRLPGHPGSTEGSGAAR